MLYVRHAGNGVGDYRERNPPAPRLCRNSSPELLLAGILYTSSVQDGHCALCYAPFPESKMPPDDESYLGDDSTLLSKNCRIESCSSAAL